MDKEGDEFDEEWSHDHLKKRHLESDPKEEERSLNTGKNGMKSSNL